MASNSITSSISRPGGCLRSNDEALAFFNWLICWIILPNLPFLPITLMGGPPRFPAIIIAGGVGLAARRLPYFLRLAAFLALMVYLVISFIASMFNMAIGMIMSVIGLVFDMSPQTSPEYVAGGLLLITTCCGAIWMLRLPQDTFHRPRWLACAAGVTLALAGADYAISKDTIGSYSRFAPAGAQFDSATTQTRFLSLADGKANLMIVIVEAMGQPTDPAIRAQLARIWARPELTHRFAISHGETAFFGSTTSGEIRELCQHWGNYAEITRPDRHCLPALLAKHGYRTSAYHAFYPGFFERDRWYPLIGIQELVFGQALLTKGASYCANVFPGACDRDIPAIIGKRLKAEQGPQFIYWLTLNSHLPIIESQELGTAGCNRPATQFDADFPMICRLFSIWSNTADALVALINRPDFPPTHILIVGDHMPPFTHQKSRLQFDARHVPWVLLRDKEAIADIQSSPE
jgi:hypothetical protein